MVADIISDGRDIGVQWLLILSEGGYRVQWLLILSEGGYRVQWLLILSEGGL